MAVTDQRGQTPVIAFVLLAGIVGIASIGILVVGSQSVSETKDAVRTERIEGAFMQLDRTIDSVGRSSDGVRSVTFDLSEGDGAIRRERTGYIALTKNGTELANASIGALEYTRDETVYAYQAGGVWRGTGGNATLVSAPDIDYQRATLTLPITVIRGDREVSPGPVRLVHERTVSPVNNVQFVENSTVRMRIKSRYYGAWADYFRTRVSGVSVTAYDHNRTVLVDLGRPEAPDGFGESALAASGDVVATQGNAEINGPVTAAGEIRTGSSASVNGRIREHADIDRLSLDTVIDTKVEAGQDGEYTNRSPSGITTLDSGTYYVDGDLDLDSEILHLDISDDNVTLIVDGNVSATNGGELRVINHGSKNDSVAARVYAAGDLTLHNSEMLVGARDQGGGSEHLQIYGRSDMQVGISGGATTYFEGVVYAPREESVDGPNQALYQAGGGRGGGGGRGRDGRRGDVVMGSFATGAGGDCTSDVCIVRGSSNVYGSMTAGSIELGQSAGLTYPDDLATATPSYMLEDGVYPPPVTYLHVMIHEVSVEDR